MELLLENPSSFMLRLLLKRWNKLLGTDLIKFQHTWSKQAGKYFLIHKLHNYILNKEKLSYQSKESIITTPVCKKVNKTHW